MPPVIVDWLGYVATVLVPVDEPRWSSHSFQCVLMSVLLVTHSTPLDDNGLALLIKVLLYVPQDAVCQASGARWCVLFLSTLM